MRILGIDPALKSTGYGLIEIDKSAFHLMEAGLIETDPKQKIQERLDKIYTIVSRIIEETNPQVLVLEKLYTHWRHPTTAYLLGHPRGIVCLACEKFKVPLVEYASTRVKKAVVGRGNASKHQVMMMVKRFLGLKIIPKQSDICDALALAIAHAFILRSNIKKA